MKKKIEYSRMIGFEGTQYIDVTTTMKITNAHRIVIEKMRNSCLKQLNENREQTGFLEYRSWQNYDPEVGEVIKNEQGLEVEACDELCILGIFDRDYDAWNTTYILADGIDWTEL